MSKNKISNQAELTNILEHSAEYITDSSGFTELDRKELVEDIRDLLVFLKGDTIANEFWHSKSPAYPCARVG